MEIIIEKGEHENRIKTLDNWLQFAPPKDSKRQWKPGRSAKLFAQFAISASFKDFMIKIMKEAGFPEVNKLICIPEYETKLPPINQSQKEGRNHDMIIYSDESDFLIGIEAKVSEPFGNKSIKAEKDSASAKSSIPERIKELMSWLQIPHECLNSDKAFKSLKYQLLTGVTGTLKEAKNRGKKKCLFLVLTFVGNGTVVNKSEQTNVDTKEKIGNNTKAFNKFKNYLRLDDSNSHRKFVIEDKAIELQMMKRNINVDYNINYEFV